MLTRLAQTTAANPKFRTRAPKSVGLLHLALAVLFLGPIVSPLFRATGLPLLSGAGLLARDLLSAYVCPTPERSYMLLGLPMAVCARCWGATIGLLLARTLFTVKTEGQESRSPRRSVLHTYTTLAWPVRLFLSALPFLLWPLELVGAARGWWYAPLWLLLMNGAQAGLFAGIFFCSAWKGLEAR